MEQITFKQAIVEVGVWSKYNFGDQKGAEALAPFTGIIEEHGEFAAANGTDEVVDASCDQLVYLADLCYRSGFVIAPEWNAYCEPSFGWAFSVGRLAHAVLKRHQGIRGLDNDDIFYAHVVEAATEVFFHIHADFDREVLNRDLGDEFTITWNRVKSRDWKKNPVDAAKIVDQEVEALKQEQPFE